MYSEALKQNGNQFNAKVLICTMLMIAPSVLSADFGRLKEEIEMLNESDAGLIHVDVMDGCFVPNISFGFPVMDVLKKYAAKPLDVHLMIEKPENYALRFADAGADWISFHLEATPHAHRLLQQIKSAGAKAGISINPQTSVFQIEDLLENLDFVNIMSVNPGFGGQSFIPKSLKKVETLAELRKKSNLNFLIEVDGGVSLNNIRSLSEAGADVMVAGNSVFKSDSPKNAISELIRICG
jgi:ribulose-phosphate 3-epimerase